MKSLTFLGLMRNLLLLFAVFFLVGCTDNKEPYVTSPEPTQEVEPEGE